MSDLLKNLDDRGVLTLTMNRLEKSNAFDDGLIGLLNAALLDAADDDAVKVVCLRGAGKHFSAGADLGWMQRMAKYSETENQADAWQLAQLMNNLYRLPKPTVAVVQGAAYGGAVGLAACCDTVFASERASFCLSEVKVGLIPATISPFVIRAIGERQARRYFLSAEVIRADKALAIGLAHEVVTADALDQAVDAWCDAVLGNSAVAVVAAKQLIDDIAGAEISVDLLRMTSERIAAIRVSPDGQARLKRFLDS